MELTPREYQKNIFNSILKKGNTLVVLPTGIGKTLIGLMLINEKKEQGKCLFLAPTKPLAEQHHKSIINILGINPEDAVLVTGAKPPKKRKELYEKQIIVATPQTIRNDLENKIIAPDFSLVIFDECHRAVKDYAYSKIAKQLPKKTLMVGLTASPGGKKIKIQEVLARLNIQNVELRTTEDKDVKAYAHETEINWQFVDLPPRYIKIRIELETLIKKYARLLGSFGFPPPLKSKTQFMQMRGRILKLPGSRKYMLLMHYSILLNLLHMVELLETQSLSALQNYIQKLKEKETKSAKILLNKPEIQKILEEEPEAHPKIKLLSELVSKLNGKKTIVFAQYRDQVLQLSHHLDSLGYQAKAFMGKKDKYTRKQQEETIQEFRDGKFQFLCSSSIGEEGLDIPAVDAVIFYEPIPSEIRSIQRRGRTGRFSKGEVHILITRKSRDEYFYWASLNREKKMKKILSSFNPETGKLTSCKPEQTNINKFI